MSAIRAEQQTDAGNLLQITFLQSYIVPPSAESTMSLRSAHSCLLWYLKKKPSNAQKETHTGLALPTMNPVYCLRGKDSKTSQEQNCTAPSDTENVPVCVCLLRGKGELTEEEYFN